MKKLLVHLSVLAAFLMLTVGAYAQDDYAGYIAVIGNDHNVYVYGGAFSEPYALTQDATPNQRYQFPTWSTDGRLAFFCCDLAFSAAPALEVYVASADLTAAKSLYSTAGEGYTYGAWAPSNCVEGDNCRELAVLVTRPVGSFKVEIIRQTSAGVTTKTAANGAPFYFSWNRDGKRMLWHRDNRSLSVFDSETGTITDNTAVTPLLFQAPSWSPVDDRSAVAVSEAGASASALTILDADGTTDKVLSAPIEGLNNFSWSPDGRYIAYRLVSRTELSAVQVYDTETGALVASSPDNNVVSFFWSPDSTTLAYITPDFRGGVSAPSAQFVAQTQPNNPISLVWNVLEVETNQARSLSRFAPTRSFLYMLSYFDQFNQSHQIWSPDSRHLVYAEVLDNSGGTVTIIEVETGDTTPLMGGDIAIWSYK